MILYGDVVAQELIEKAKKENNHGKLVIVGNKEDVASRVYIRNKIKNAKNVELSIVRFIHKKAQTLRTI